MFLLMFLVIMNPFIPSFSYMFLFLMNNTINSRVGQVVLIWYLGILQGYQSLPCALFMEVKNFSSLGVIWWQGYILC